MSTSARAARQVLSAMNPDFDARRTGQGVRAV